MLAAPEYFIGVDLGQKHDFSAVAVVERREGGRPHFLSTLEAEPAICHLRHLERIALGTPYPKVVERVAWLTRAPEMGGRSTVVVDGTGVGGPVVDLLRRADLDGYLVAVTITGGEREHRTEGGRSVPKRDLIATLEVMLEEQELRIAARLPERRRLIEELMSMRAMPLENGREAYGASGRKHDDLVLAVALACWGARRGTVGEQGQRLL